MAWTLEEAKQHLTAWLKADIKLASGQEYWVGNRKLVRSDAGYVKERIEYWRGEVARLSANGRIRRTYRVVPRDL